MSTEKRINSELAAECEALKAERDALAVENAELKSGCGFFMYSPDAGFEQHKTHEDAINAALEMIDDYRSDAGDGWCEEAERVFCGVILQQAVECDHQKPSEDNGYLGSMDYKLYPPIETPATDAALAAIKKQAGIEAVEEAAYSLYGKGYIFDTIMDYATELREAK